MKLMIAVAVAVAGAAASYLAPSPSGRDVDQISTASISDTGGGVGYTVANAADNTTCLISRGKGNSSRTSTIKAEERCEEVWPHLSEARNWTVNSDGSVTVTDTSGGEVLTLGRGDGVDFVAVDPPSAAITLTATR